ncbi:MAG: GNAT family N-acetyltransferase [Parachlamydiaceae bacterium]|nr:GNAT family N-acetyltransferase [Parachlamydiaceae bacterium]
MGTRSIHLQHIRRQLCLCCRPEWTYCRICKPNSFRLFKSILHSKDFQGQGIGKLLLETLENKAKTLNLIEMTTEASITAKPFFLAKGWQIDEQQTVILREVSFINYKMHKCLIG